MAEQIGSPMVVSDLPNYVVEPHLYRIDAQIAFNKRKVAERVFLTFSMLFAAFTGALVFMRDDLVSFLHKPYLTIDELVYYSVHNAGVLLLSVLIVPQIFFKSFGVNYYTVILVLVFFVLGVSRGLIYRNTEVVKIGYFPHSMVWFCVIAACELACGIVAIGLHIANARTKIVESAPPQDKAKYRVREVKEAVSSEYLISRSQYEQM